MTAGLSLEALERRISALELRFDADQPTDIARVLRTLLLRRADGTLRNQRLPKYWNDLPVREAAIASHRQSTIAVATAQLVEQFGAKRAPSESALQRLWRALDMAFESAAQRRTDGTPDTGAERA